MRHARLRHLLPKGIIPMKDHPHITALLDGGRAYVLDELDAKLALVNHDPELVTLFQGLLHAQLTTVVGLLDRLVSPVDCPRLAPRQRASTSEAAAAVQSRQ